MGLHHAAHQHLTEVAPSWPSAAAAAAACCCCLLLLLLAASHAIGAGLMYALSTSCILSNPREPLPCGRTAAALRMCPCQQSSPGQDGINDGCWQNMPERVAQQGCSTPSPDPPCSCDGHASSAGKRKGSKLTTTPHLQSSHRVPTEFKKAPRKPSSQRA